MFNSPKEQDTLSYQAYLLAELALKDFSLQQGIQQEANFTSEEWREHLYGIPALVAEEYLKDTLELGEHSLWDIHIEAIEQIDGTYNPKLYIVTFGGVSKKDFFKTEDIGEATYYSAHIQGQD